MIWGARSTHSNRLWAPGTFTWYLDDDADTTTKASDCAYVLVLWRRLLDIL